eukprot:364515-Chlamydomonas_euryale.AAC.9
MQEGSAWHVSKCMQSSDPSKDNHVPSLSPILPSRCQGPVRQLHSLECLAAMHGRKCAHAWRKCAHAWRECAHAWRECAPRIDHVGPHGNYMVRNCIACAANRCSNVML